ncbi:MAG TPA: 3-oxoacyl-[acyl-carrier-protein] synthase III C-terminal domain-containing protein [Candidatus Limnocylindria bacterium]|nr:3-oxoacyl-[acyl-carrier-protein] synthase III C-terminal domain-containing protein [Candidatus Limnocylindria bacterium]
MTVIAAVGTALGAHAYDQETITSVFGRHVVGDDASARAVLERLHAHTGVRTRHLALPLEDYPRLDGFTGANDAWLRVGVPLGADAVRRALALAGLEPRDVDLLMTTTVTGVAAPSLDARLVQPLGLRPDVKRVPMFGLGCVAGVAGVARVHDYLMGHPDDVAVLLAVELCSLTVQPDDTSVANLVASGLFGDGAAAVVLVGERRAAALGISGPRVVTSRSTFYDDTERVMGWDVGSSGLRIVLAASVADVVRDNLGSDVKEFLAEHELDVADVQHWVAHPGGPKVVDAVVETLGLPAAALDRTRASLAAVGNLSSASVLHVLDDTLTAHPPGSGEPVVMLAMGPGFCSELVLLRW